ncbi:MAG: AAA family ATPase [Phycisphaerales bacterium]
MPESLKPLRDNITRVFYGNAEAVDRAICCLLARGHLLIEDVPGVGKTVLATALARSIDCSFSRIQLTPDMLPSDILGTSVLDRTTNDFVFRRGPIFANIVLADEVNRTPPRTQSALLEAMNEATVSIDGRVMKLEPPFMVIATQNPYEFEGTYALPENQLDRFLARISLGYPSNKDEARVLERRPSASELTNLQPVLHGDDVVRLQAAVDAVRIAPPLLDYLVRLATATRKHPALLVGVSPRGLLALAQAARAAAFYRGRDHAIPEDVVDHVVTVCAHRVVIKGGGAATRTAEQVLREILDAVPSPV